MAVKTVYKSKLGAGYKISEHFTLGEMACKDGSDKVLYSTELMDKLEEIRAYVGGSIHINSGYRTLAYTKAHGWGTKSQHILGTAADIVVYDCNGSVIDAKKICCLCQSLGFKGIGYMSYRALHVDMRTSGSYRGDETIDYSNNVGGDFYKHFGITKTAIEGLKAAHEAVETAEVEEKTEDERMYKDINEVPEWGKDSVQFRVDLGITDGKNLTESMVRCWVIDDREDPFIKNLEDVPEWLFETAKRWISDGVIAGDGRYQIGKRLSQLETLVMADRLKEEK